MSLTQRVLLTVLVGSISLLALCGLRWATTLSPRTLQTSTQNIPVFYIINSRIFDNIEGGKSIVLDYSKDGSIQTQGIFQTPQMRDAFIDHLETLGVVLNEKVITE